MEKMKNPHAKGAGAQVSFGHNTDSSIAKRIKKPILSLALDHNHTVHLSRDGGAYLVAVVPPVDDYPPQLFPTHKAARGFAGGIRMCRGWPIQDETGGANG